MVHVPTLGTSITELLYSSHSCTHNLYGYVRMRYAITDR
jgi:hypothetical protein